MNKVFSVTLIAILLLTSTGTACARQKVAKHKILVAGNPALTQERVNDSSGSNDLVGEWSTSTQEFSLFRNSAKDVFANAGSSVRSFKISADGRVEFATFFTQSLSTCVTKIFRTSAGRMNVSGDKIAFDYAPGKVQSQNNCDSARNYTKTIDAELQTFTYTLEPFNNSLKLCLLDADNASYCVYKK